MEQLRHSKAKLSTKMLFPIISIFKVILHRSLKNTFATVSTFTFSDSASHCSVKFGVRTTEVETL